MHLYGAIIVESNRNSCAITVSAVIDSDAPVKNGKTSTSVVIRVSAKYCDSWECRLIQQNIRAVIQVLMAFDMFFRFFVSVTFGISFRLRKLVMEMASKFADRQVDHSNQKSCCSLISLQWVIASEAIKRNMNKLSGWLSGFCNAVIKGLAIFFCRVFMLCSNEWVCLRLITR